MVVIIFVRNLYYNRARLMPSQCRYLKFKNEVQLQKSGQLNEVENPA